jgi:hypothetical protein
MTTIDQCVRQIVLVRLASADPRTAYLIRSRIRRAILSCIALVAEETQASAPDIPGIYVAPADCQPACRQIVAICNRVYSYTRELCQPSESFDLRWEAGWHTLATDFDALEQLLLRWSVSGDIPRIPLARDGAPSVRGR